MELSVGLTKKVEKINQNRHFLRLRVSVFVYIHYKNTPVFHKENGGICYSILIVMAITLAFFKTIGCEMETFCVAVTTALGFSKVLCACISPVPKTVSCIL